MSNNYKKFKDLDTKVLDDYSETKKYIPEKEITRLIKKPLKEITPIGVEQNLKDTHNALCYDLYQQDLISLEGMNNNDFVGYLYLQKNHLEDCKGMPPIILNNCSISTNPLKTLEGCSKTIGEDFDCQSTTLYSMEHGPLYIGGNCFYGYNNIKNLDFLPKYIGNELNLKGNPLLSDDFTKVFAVEGLQCVRGDSKAWDVINRHLPRKENFDIEVVKAELVYNNFYVEAGYQPPTPKAKRKVKDLVKTLKNSLASLEENKKGVIRTVDEYLETRHQKLKAEETRKHLMAILNELAPIPPTRKM